MTHPAMDPCHDRACYTVLHRRCPLPFMVFPLHTRDYVPIESAESIHCSSSSIDSLHELLVGLSLSVACLLLLIVNPW